MLFAALIISESIDEILLLCKILDIERMPINMLLAFFEYLVNKTLLKFARRYKFNLAKPAMDQISSRRTRGEDSISTYKDRPRC